MKNREEIGKEIAEIENSKALLIEEIHGYRLKYNDSADRRVTLARMQIELGKKVRQLNELYKLI